MYVMNRHIIAYVARDDTAVGDAYRNSEVVIFEHLSFYPADSYQSEETVTFHHLRIKLISHQNIIPVSSDVFIVHQTLYLIGTQMTPFLLGKHRLLISEIILILTFRNIFLIDEILINPIIRKDSNLIVICHFLIFRVILKF